MNNPYASPAPAYPPAGGFGAPQQMDPYAQQQRGGGAEVSEASVELLRQTKPWVTFLSVMGFIGSAFALLGGILMMVAGALMPSNSASPLPTAALGAFYIPFAFIYIYPSLKMWSYGSAIGRLLQSRSATDLEAALSQQKSFWKFLGIMTIVTIALYILFFVGMMIVGVAAAGSRH